MRSLYFLMQIKVKHGLIISMHCWQLFLTTMMSYATIFKINML